MCTNRSYFQGRKGHILWTPKNVQIHRLKMWKEIILLNYRITLPGKHAFFGHIAGCWPKSMPLLRQWFHGTIRNHPDPSCPRLWRYQAYSVSTGTTLKAGFLVVFWQSHVLHGPHGTIVYLPTWMVGFMVKVGKNTYLRWSIWEW